MAGWAIYAQRKRLENYDQEHEKKKQILQLCEYLETDRMNTAGEYGLKFRYQPKSPFVALMKLLHKKMLERSLLNIMQYLRTDSELKQCLTEAFANCGVPGDINTQLIVESFMALLLLSFVNHKMKHIMCDMQLTLTTFAASRALRDGLKRYEMSLNKSNA